MVKLPESWTFQPKLTVSEVIATVCIGVNVLLSVVYDTVTFDPAINGDMWMVIVIF
jgi:hypothetical protein